LDGETNFGVTSLAAPKAKEEGREMYVHYHKRWIVACAMTVF
jgi:hypothetical protein